MLQANEDRLPLSGLLLDYAEALFMKHARVENERNFPSECVTRA
jgi:hypothetical protein